MWEAGTPVLTGIIPARAGFTPPGRPRDHGPEDHPRSRGVYKTSAAATGAASGSSPLARGLPRKGGGTHPTTGIIPARAGFTFLPAHALECPADHPRSRGVYGSPLFSCHPGSGSSPLARGLPRGLEIPIVQPGIIPARAGFTRDPRGERPRRPDHPRSRGVYTANSDGSARARGSSPLARGLPPQGHRRVGAAGIIPARAGFTPRAGPTARTRRDHPRSRGVYRPARRSAAQRRGSSPLARGLPPTQSRRRPGRGIIPARAGFTLGGAVRGCFGGDHPRSRGVYQGAVEGALVGVGIIPARAGFTECGREPHPHRMDHPRSRGVYGGFRVLRVIPRGSSPLARGLPLEEAQVRVGDGIIPARAGFTGAARGPPSTPTDHPRSRGVYLQGHHGAAEPAGSSPLARGLLDYSPDHDDAVGIIPARAGFTPAVWVRTIPTDWIIPARAGFTGMGDPRTRASTDHPRSRGVYPRSCATTAARSGSSPLARGLPASPAEPSAPPRIIPARAGFTRSSSPRPPRWADHPRSRGVYLSTAGR